MIFAMAFDCDFANVIVQGMNQKYGFCKIVENWCVFSQLELVSMQRLKRVTFFHTILEINKLNCLVQKKIRLRKKAWFSDYHFRFDKRKCATEKKSVVSSFRF